MLRILNFLLYDAEKFSLKISKDLKFEDESEDENRVEEKLARSVIFHDTEFFNLLFTLLENETLFEEAFKLIVNFPVKE